MINLINNLNNTGGSFCRFALSMLIQSGILIVLLYLIDLLIRKHARAVFRYCIWMLVFMKLILPVSLSSPLSFGRLFGDKITVGNTEAYTSIDGNRKNLSGLVVPIDTTISPKLDATGNRNISSELSRKFEQVQIKPIEEITNIPQRPTSIIWQAVVFLIWLVGILILSILLFQRFLFVKSLLAQSDKSNCRLNKTLQQCCQQVGIRRNIELRLSKNMLSPAACGLFKPVILIPVSLLENLSREKLRAVLIHELIHIKRGDLWVNFIQTLMQIVYFYNPLLWFVNSVVRDIREKAVDEIVLTKLGSEADSYSKTLIDIAEIAFSRLHLSLRLVSIVESKKALPDRIRHIFSRPFPKTTRLGVTSLATIIITAAMLLPMAKGKEAEFPIVRKPTSKSIANEQRKISCIPEDSAYENAKKAKNYKIVAGSREFDISAVVRYMQNGQPIIKNPDGSEKQVVEIKTSEFSPESQWMDIVQIYLDPEESMYDVSELRVFDHYSRKFLGFEDYPGIGYHINNSVVTIYSIEKMLPKSIDLWMRVLPRTTKQTYTLQANKQATVDVDGNMFRIIDIAKGQYNWTNGKRTEKVGQWSECITSVAVKFDESGNKKYQICAIDIDGHRIVPNSPDFLCPSNGWQLVEFGISMDNIKYFEISPFDGIYSFFFDDVKIPPRLKSLGVIPPVRFEINGKGGKHRKHVDSLFDIELNVLPNTEITEASGITNGFGDSCFSYTKKDSAESLTAIVCKVNGLGIKNVTFRAYDEERNLLDLSPHQTRYRGGIRNSLHYIETKIPADNIYMIDVYFEDTRNPEKRYESEN